MTKYTNLFLILSLITITSCSSLSKEQCLTGDWQGIGYSDGVVGYYPSRIQAHQQACAKTGVSINYKLYEKGRKEGLKQYCTKENALRLGLSGYTLHNVCPDRLTQQLTQYNNTGLNQYHINKELSQQKRTLAKYKKQLQRLENGEMLDFKTEREARRAMLKLQKDILLLKYNIQKLEREAEIKR